MSVWEFETFSAIAWTVLLSLSTLVSSEITPFFSFSLTEGRVVYCGRNGAIKERKGTLTYSAGQSCVTLASTTCGRLSKSTVQARTYLKHAPPFSVVQSSDAIIIFFFFLTWEHISNVIFFHVTSVNGMHWGWTTSEKQLETLVSCLVSVSVILSSSFSSRDFDGRRS